MAVVLDAVVMLVVLESSAVLVVVVTLFVEGRHSEHALHVAHWHRIVQGCDCDSCWQVERQAEAYPGGVVVVIKNPPTGVVVVTVSEVAVVVVRVDVEKK